MTDAQLERVHDYIQWLFPLRERSGANPSAPTLNGAAIEAFAARPELRQGLRDALVRMLAFYGLTMHDDRIQPADTFATRAELWLHPGNHNHLRLTRIIGSLRTLGLEAEAQALFASLRAIHDAYPSRITPTSFAYWSDAASA